MAEQAQPGQGTLTFKLVLVGDGGTGKVNRSLISLVAIFIQSEHSNYRLALAASQRFPGRPPNPPSVRFNLYSRAFN
jgi:hypothetical protein